MSIIDNINWENDAENITVTNIPSYPRLFKMSNGTMLCGIDGFCFTSDNNGKSWSSGYDYRQNHYHIGPNGSKYELSCANSAFIELPDGTILVGYRATGYINNDRSLFCTKLLVSQSTDCGKTWTPHSVICEYYDDEGQFKGVWEPHFGFIDGILTCFYANDSRSVIAPPQQNVESIQFIDGEWVNRRIVADGTKNSSREGMPVWQKLSCGRYVCAIEGTYPNTNEMCIKITFSEDGIFWEAPQVIYRCPRGYAGAPYVVELPTGQLLVTFQNTEHHCLCILSNENDFKKTSSISFKAPINVFGTQKDHFARWNALYLTEDYLFAITGTDESLCGSGTVIKRISLTDLNNNVN